MAEYLTLENGRKYKIAFESGRLSYNDLGVDFLNHTMNLLLTESASRGHELYHFSAKDVYSHNGAPYAWMSELEINGKFNEGPDSYKNIRKKGESDVALSDIDIYFLRADDINPFTPNIELIEEAEKDSLFLVNMKSIVETTDKYELNLRCPDVPLPVTFAVDSIVDAMAAIKELPDREGYFVLKDRYGGCGTGIHRLRFNARGLEFIVMTYLEDYGHLILQEYCPEISEGDLRIMFLDDVAFPALLRLPEKGEWKTNSFLGSKAFRYEATPKQMEIAKTVVKNFPGSRFSAVDMLPSGKVFEINVMPGSKGLHVAYGINVGKIIMDKMEREAAEIWEKKNELYSRARVIELQIA